MWVSRVLGNYHYQRMSLVTVGVARERTSNAQWPWEPSIGHNVQPFTDNGTVSIWVNNSPVGRKTTPKKQINCTDCVYLVYTLYTEFTRTVLLQNTLKPLKRMVLHLNKIFNLDAFLIPLTVYALRDIRVLEGAAYTLSRSYLPGFVTFTSYIYQSPVSNIKP